MKEMTAIKKQQGRKRFHFFKRFIKNLLQAMINFGFASEFDRKNLTIFKCAFPGLFLYIHLFNAVDSEQMFYIKVCR